MPTGCKYKVWLVGTDQYYAVIVGGIKGKQSIAENSLQGHFSPNLYHWWYKYELGLIWEHPGSFYERLTGQTFKAWYYDLPTVHEFEWSELCWFLLRCSSSLVSQSVWLASTNFTRDLCRVWLNLSTRPLVWGWYAELILCSVFCHGEKQLADCIDEFSSLVRNHDLCAAIPITM